MIPGQRAPLVVVPGLGLAAAAVRATLEAIGADAHVVTLPGYGQRAARGERLHPGALAEALVTRLRELALRPAVLLGHSASCQVVAHAAALAPAAVRGLVLVGPTTDPRARSWPALMRRWCATAGHEPVWQVPLLIRLYSRTGVISMLRVMNAARHDDIEDALAGVGCPVLVLRGLRDRIAPSDWAARCAGTGSAVTLPSGAHMVPLTQPAAVAAVVTAFLETAGAEPLP